MTDMSAAFVLVCVGATGLFFCDLHALTSENSVPFKTVADTRVVTFRPCMHNLLAAKNYLVSLDILKKTTYARGRNRLVLIEKMNERVEGQFALP